MQMQSESIAKLAEALSKAKAEMKVAKQSGVNTFFKSAASKEGSRYSTMADISESQSEALSNNGLSPVVVQPCCMDGQWMAVGKLMHSSGEWIAGYVPLMTGKGDMQSFKSATTYAQRLLTLLLTGGVSGEDDDGNAAVGREPAVHKKQAKAMEGLASLRKLCEAGNPEEAHKFLQKIKLREAEKAIPAGTTDKAQKMFDDFFVEETASG
jgi:hypothetical protein